MPTAWTTVALPPSSSWACASSAARPGSGASGRCCHCTPMAATKSASETRWDARAPMVLPGRRVGALELRVDELAHLGRLVGLDEGLQARVLLMARARGDQHGHVRRVRGFQRQRILRSEEHTSELQSPCNLVCRLLLEKKKRE